jgi:transposase-like protein
MMAERGLVLAHTTIMRWVKRFTPGAIKFEVQHLARVRCAHARKNAVSTASA